MRRTLLGLCLGVFLTIMPGFHSLCADSREPWYTTTVTPGTLTEDGLSTISWHRLSGQHALIHRMNAAGSLVFIRPGTKVWIVESSAIPACVKIRSARYPDLWIERDLLSQSRPSREDSADPDLAYAYASTTRPFLTKPHARVATTRDALLKAIRLETASDRRILESMTANKETYRVESGQKVWVTGPVKGYEPVEIRADGFNNTLWISGIDLVPPK